MLIRDLESTKVKTYIFNVEVEQDDDGRWGAEVPVLPGCAAWGYTKKEALEALKETAQAILEVMIEHNDPLPQEAEQEVEILSGSDVVTVTI